MKILIFSKNDQENEIMNFLIKTEMIFKTSLLLLSMFIQSGSFQLIRSNEVYQKLIKDVFTHYQCESVILFCAHESSYENQAIDISTKLNNLYVSLSKNMISTTISNIDDFIKKSNQYLGDLGNKFLVFLDDSEVLLHQLMTKLSPLTNMSQSVWLIFTEDDENIDKVFSDFYVPYNSRFMLSKRDVQYDEDNEILIEIYKISQKSKLIKKIIGRWKQSSGIFDYSPISLSRRRMDMNGHELRVTTRPEIRKAFKKSDKIHSANFADFFMIAFDTLQKGLNFTTTFQESVDTGTYLPNGTWTGAIANLVYNVSDVYLTYLRIDHTINGVIGYTSPFYIAKDSFYFHQPDPSLIWDTFLHPFNTQIWIVLLCFILFSATLIKLLITFYQKQQPLGNHLISSCPYLDVFGAMCGQAMPTSTITSVRIIQSTVHLTAVVIFAAYSGIIISTLATKSNKQTLTTLDDMINDDSFQVRIRPNFPSIQFFEDSPNQKIRQFVKKKKLLEIFGPLSDPEGLVWACNGVKYGYYTSNLISERMKPHGCDLSSTEIINHVSVGLGLQRNSPYRKAMNFYFSLMKENGILKKTLDETKKIPPIEIDNTQVLPVDFEDIVPVIVFLMVSYIISILLLLFERLIHTQMMMNRHKKNCRKLELSSLLRASIRIQQMKLRK